MDSQQASGHQSDAANLPNEGRVTSYAGPASTGSMSPSAASSSATIPSATSPPVSSAPSVSSTSSSATSSSTESMRPVSVAAPTKSTFQPKKRKAFLKLALPALAFLLLAATVVNHLTPKEPDQPLLASSIAIDLTDLGSVDDLDVEPNGQLRINGQLVVNGALVLPTKDETTRPTRGQLYLDATTNSLQYYNGFDYVEVAERRSVISSIGGITGAVSLGQGLTLDAGVLSANLASVQDLLNEVRFEAGNGIALNGTTITNTGVVGLTTSGDLTLTDLGNGRFNLFSTVGVALAPQLAQLDSTNRSTINLNKTGTGNFIQLANAGSDVFSITSTGATTIADSLTVTGPATFGDSLTVTGDLEVDAASQLRVNTIARTNTTADLAIDAGSNSLVFQAYGRLFTFEDTGPANQTICTAGINCARGAGTAVLLAPSSIQVDDSGNASIYINDIGGGLLAQLQADGIDQFTLDRTGNISTAGNITLGGDTISSDGPLAIGTTTNNLTLQGSGTSIRNSANGFTQVLSFQTPSADVTYQIEDAPAGVYGICTTTGNCAGVGGGVTTPGGTLGQLARFSGSQTIVDSIIADNGTIVTIAGGLTTTGTTNLQGDVTAGGNVQVTGDTTTGNLSVTGNAQVGGDISGTNGSFTGNVSVQNTLAVDTITRASVSLTIGETSYPLLLQGSTTQLRAQDNGFSSTLVFDTPSGTNKTITIPNASGTVAVTASGPIMLDALGDISCPTCVVSGGGANGAVDTLNLLNGALTLQGTTNQITVTDNGTDTITLSLPQDINTNSNVAFNNQSLAGTLTVTGNTSLSTLTTSGLASLNELDVTTNTTVGGNLSIAGDTQANAVTATSVDVTANTTVGGDFSVVGNSTLTTVTASGLVNANALQVTNNVIVDGGLSVQAAITGGSTLQVDGALISGNPTLAGLLSLHDGNSNTGTVQLAPLGQNTLYTLPDPGQVAVDICLSTGNCAGAGSGVTGSGTSGQIAYFDAAQNIISSASLLFDGTNLNVDSNTLYVDGTNDRVGIGTATPSQKLDVSGSAAISGQLYMPSTTNANQNGVLLKNNTRFLHDFNYGNNGTVTTSGGNLFLGLFSGNYTMGSNATQTYQASQNTGIGYATLWQNQRGYGNTAVGNSALFSNTNGYINTAIGMNALYDNTTGYMNTAVGYSALTYNTTGSLNTAIGINTLNSNTIGTHNVALGHNSLFYNTSGTTNIGIGFSALTRNTTGIRNIAIGSSAGSYLHNGTTYNTISSDSMYLGHNTTASADGNTNEIVIGSNAAGNGSNSVTLGSTAITKTVLQGDVGIGNTAPGYKLDVSGDINTTGVYRVNGVQISTSDLSDNANIALLDANQTFTGNNVFSGTLSVGTANSYGQLTLGNNQWLVGENAAGTGGINILKVNAQNQIQLGTALSIDGGFIFPEDAGMVSFTDLPISAAATAGTAMGYTFNIDSDNIFTAYGEADGAGGVQNRRLGVLTANPTATLDVQGTGLFSGNLSLNSNLVFNNSGFTGSLTQGTLTTNRTYTLPDASGTICLDSGNCAGAGGGITGSGTAGQVAYFDAAQNIISSANLLFDGLNLNVDDGTFFVDGTNNRVGIGTTSPGNALQVRSSAGFSVTTSNGISVLSVSSDSSPSVGISGSGSATSLTPLQNSVNLGFTSRYYNGTSSVNTASYIYQKAINTAGLNGLVVNSGGSDRLLVTNTGRVGVNAMDPQAGLHVSAAELTDTSLLVKRISGQTSDSFRIEDASGNAQVYVNQYGQLFAGTASFSNSVGIGISASSGASLRIAPKTNAEVTLMVMGTGTQTGDVLQVDTDSLVVKPSGYVGIGTAAPGANLEVYGSGADVELLVKENAGTHEARLRLARGGTDWEVINSPTAGLSFEHEGSRLASLGASGGFTIGNSTYNGSVLFNNGANRTVLSTNTVSANRTINLPDNNGTLCLQSDSACGFATGSGQAFVQGGNTFGATAVIGTQDAQRLNLMTNNITRLGINSVGAVTLGTPSTTTARLGIRSLGTPSPILVLESVAGQTADLLQINSDGATTGDLLVVNASGQVGIGTTSLGSAKLSVAGTSSGIVTGLSLSNTTSPAADRGVGIELDGSSSISMARIQSAWTGATNADAYLRFFTRGGGTIAERLRIAADGNVGIGIQGPGEKLHVSGNIRLTGNLLMANGFSGAITQGALTQARTYTLPDADGTFCLTSGNCAGAGSGVTGSGTANQIAYFNNTQNIVSSANLLFDGTTLNVDSNTLYVDGTANKVGIGTTSTAGLLTVSGLSGGALNAITLVNTSAASADRGTTLLFQGQSSVNMGSIFSGWSGATNSDSYLSFSTRGSASASEKLRITANGNVGIGLTNPNEQLEITGNFRLPTTTATTGIIYSGANPFIHTYGTANTFVGSSAGNLTLTGSYNTALGAAAFQSSVDGVNNVALGANAMQSQASGNQNVAVGVNALRNGSGASGSVAIGYNALANASSSSNVAIGAYALQSLTSGNQNIAIGGGTLGNAETISTTIAIGTGALNSLVTGNHNTALGYNTLNSLTSGASNIGFGRQALDKLASGSENAAFGYLTLGNITGGNANVAFGNGAGSGVNCSLGAGCSVSNNAIFGDEAGRLIQTGANHNAIFGYRAGYTLTTGGNNILFGYQAGDNLTTGSNNVIIGYNVDAVSATASNQLNIANILHSNDTTVGNLGIGTTNPGYKLTVEGSSQFRNTNHQIRIYDTDTGADEWSISTIDQALSFYEDASTPRFTLQNGGDVGIGTTNPGQRLDVAGNIRTRASGTATSTTQYASGDMILQGSSWDTTANAGAGGAVSSQFSLRNTGLSGAGVNSRFGIFNNAGSELFSITQSGQVGIGAIPSAQLHLVPGAASRVGFIIRAYIGQSANMAEFRDSTNTLRSGLTSTGQLFNTNSGFTGTLAQGTLTANRTYTLPDADGTFCLTSGNCPSGGNISGSAAAGQVAYFDGVNTLAGNNNFFWDSANSRLGIGTTSPSDILTIAPGGTTATALAVKDNQGTANRIVLRLNSNSGVVQINASNSSRILLHSNSDSYFNNSGNFGIGTETPGQKLDVNGNIRTRTTGTADSVTQYASGDMILQGSSWDTTANAGAGGAVDNQFSLRNTGLSGAGNLYRFGIVDNAGTEVLSVHQNGTVGIGTTASSNIYKFMVQDGNALIQKGAGGTQALLTLNRTSGSSIRALDVQFGGNTNLSITPMGNVSTNGTLNVAGSATFDTNTLFVDATGNNVGIGTVTPTLQLQTTTNLGLVNSTNQTAVYFSSDASLGKIVSEKHDFTTTGRPLAFFTKSGASSESMRIDALGNVGIGTTNPSTKLEVAGNITSKETSQINLETNGAGPRLRFGSAASAGTYMEVFSGGGTNNIDTKTRDFRVYSTTDTVGLNYKQDTGRFGIGTTAPGALLHAAGNAIVDGTLSVGTSLSYGQLTLGNDQWMTAVNAAGTGGINILKVNSQNQIQLGSALSIDGGFNFPADGGLITFTDMQVTAATPQGTAHGYSMKLDAENAITISGESDGAGSIQNLRVGIGTATPGYNLDVSGAINLTGALSNNGTSVITAGREIMAANGVEGTPAYRFAGDTNTGMYRAGSDELGFSTGGTARMLINASGNVGIGTASPISLLHIASSDGITSQNNSAAMIRIQNTSTANNRAVLRLTKADGTSGTHYADYRLNNAGTLEIATGMSGTDLDTPKLVVTSGGNVGIGTTITPSSKLEVAGSVKILSGNQLILDNASGTRLASIRNTGASSNSTIEFLTGAGAAPTTKMILDQNGNVGIGTTLPSEKLDVSGNLRVYDQTPITGSSSITVRAGAGQSGNLINIQNSAGTQLANIDNAGRFGANVGYSTFPGYRFQGDGDTGLFGGSDVLGFSTGGLERARIDASGNVGIGTATTTGKLTVSGSTASQPLLSIATTDDSTGARVIDVKGTTSDIFNVNANGVLRLLRSSDGRGLQVDASGAGGVIFTRSGPSAGSDAQFKFQGSSNSNLTFGVRITGTSQTSNAFAIQDASDRELAGFKVDGALFVHATPVTADAGLNNSPLMTLLARYDSDNTAGVLSANTTASFQHVVTAGGVSPASRLAVTVGSTEAMSILNNGNVGIGVTNPGYKLDVADDINLTGRLRVGGTQALYVPGGNFVNTMVLGDGGQNLSYTSGVDGARNTLIGFGVGTALTTGANNTALGAQALQNNTTGTHNTALGVHALRNNVTAQQNTAIGTYALLNTTSGRNTAIGYNALQGNTSGYDNVSLGYQAGMYLTDGTTANATSNTSVFLGGNTKASVAGGSNEIVIGYNAIGAGNNSVVLGNDSITKTLLKGNVGIGTASPGLDLTVERDANRSVGISAGNLSTGTNATAALSLYNNNYDFANLDMYGSNKTAFGLLTANTAVLRTSAANGLALIAQNASAPILFATGGTDAANERMRIDSAGNVGIGTGATSLTHKLTVVSDTNLGGISIVGNGGNANTSLTLDNGEGNAYRLSITDSVHSEGAGKLLIQNNVNPVMAFDTSGNVGIGTTAPGAKLDVTSSSGSEFAGRFINNSTGSFSSGLYVQTQNTSGNDAVLQLTSNAGANELLMVRANGNVGIGTTNPLSTFHVSSSTQPTNVFGGAGTPLSVGALFSVDGTTSSQSTYGRVAIAPVQDYGTTELYFSNRAPGFTYSEYGSGVRHEWGGSDARNASLQLFTSNYTASQQNVARLTIDPYGSVQLNSYGAGTLTTDASGNVTASSDARLKNVQGEFGRGLSDVLALDPVLYKWNGVSGLEQSSTYAGFTAQNVRDSIPEAVSVDPRGYLTLQDRPILAALVNATKEVNTLITNHETRIKALEANLGTTSTGGYLKNGDAASFSSLNVSGNTTLSGTLRVKGNATFDKNVLVGGTLTVNNDLVAKADLYVEGRLISRGKTAVVTVMEALGTSDATVNPLPAVLASAEIKGTDTAGTLVLTAGTAAADGEVVKVQFSEVYTAQPRVLVTAKDATGASIRWFVEVEADMSGFTLNALDQLTEGETYSLDYFVIASEVVSE